MMALSKVKYRSIPGFPGYRVGDDGSVWSCWHGQPRMMTRRWVKRKVKANRSQYRRVVLSVNKKKYRFRVHELIAAVFIGPRPKGMYVIHGPKGSRCDALDNISYGTPKQNQMDRIRDGTACLGSKHPNSKLVESQVREIMSLKAKGLSQYAIAKRFGVTRENIRSIHHGKSWGHLLKNN